MTTATTSTGRGFALAVAVAAAASNVINAVISLVAQALGADASVLMGLQPPFYIAFTVVGLLLAATAWVIVRARAANPSAVMRWLIPTVVAVSLIPDLLVGLTAGWGALALALMHISVAVCGVAALRRFLPLPR